VRLRLCETVGIPRDWTTSEAGCKPRERGVQSDDVAVVDRAGGVGHEVAEPQHAAGVREARCERDGGANRAIDRMSQGTRDGILPDRNTNQPAQTIATGIRIPSAASIVEVK
jgi:hypothetical protein